MFPPRSRLFACYLIVFAIISLSYGFLNAQLNHPWAIGEWLINYKAGFVRRGLMGELFLFMARITHIHLNWLVYILQTAAYVTFFVSAYLLARRVRLSLLVCAIIFSPAVFSFIVLDPPNGFKKEILFFALLGVTLLVLQRARPRDWQLSLLLSILGTLLILSHEPIFFYLPYLLAGAVLATPRLQRALAIIAAPVLVWSAAAVLAARHPGTVAMASIICTSVGGTIKPFGVNDGSICSGGIVWLGQTLAEAHRRTMLRITVGHAAQLYGILSILVFAPIVTILVLLYRRHHLHRQVRVVAGFALIAAAGSTLLFYRGYDWGRWIHIHAVALTLLLLFVLADLSDSLEPQPKPRTASAYLWLAFVILYSTLWSLPAVDYYPNKTGYLGLYRYLHDYKRTHHDVPVALGQPPRDAYDISERS